MTVARHYRLIDATALPAETAATVAARLREHHIDCAPVLDEKGRLLGLVTARDLALDVLGQRADPEAVLVRDVMRKDPPTIALDATLDEAVERMRDLRTQRLLVVDDHRALHGILWLYDVANAIVGGVDEDEAPNDGELGDGQLVAVRARDVVILRRPPATVVRAVQRLETTRAVEDLVEPVRPREAVRRGRAASERHVCRGRWGCGGKDCDRTADLPNEHVFEAGG